MTIVPETRSGKIDFYRAHLPVWAQDPASIGLTPQAVAEFQPLVETAWEAYRQHLQAQLAARVATMRYHQAVRRMHAGGDGVAGGASLLQTIKTYAQITGDATVYAKASITRPSRPGRPGSVPVPGTPSGFATNVRPTGEVELTWKCDNPDGAVGTIYQVRRQVDDGPMLLVGTVGDKKFLDELMPPGTRHCTYEVTALRSTGKGASARYWMQFGRRPQDNLPSFQVKPRKLVA